MHKNLPSMVNVYRSIYWVWVMFYRNSCLRWTHLSINATNSWICSGFSLSGLLSSDLWPAALVSTETEMLHLSTRVKPGSMWGTEWKGWIACALCWSSERVMCSIFQDNTGLALTSFVVVCPLPKSHVCDRRGMLSRENKMLFVVGKNKVHEKIFCTVPAGRHLVVKWS